MTTGRKTVLIVDDDPGILYVLANGLSTILDMYDVVTAGNGREAIEVLEQRSVDVLVTDLSMPIMDGFALIAYVTNQRSTLPVVVLSGMSSHSVDQRLAGFGGLRVLSKPASYQDVAQCVLEEIERVDMGLVEGIPLAGVLQLVESERRSCTVIVRSGKRRGSLQFESGRLMNAFSEDFGAEGEAAAYDILSWSDTAIEFEHLPNTVRKLIHTPMQLMLIELAVVQDQIRSHDEASGLFSTSVEEPMVGMPATNVDEKPASAPDDAASPWESESAAHAPAWAAAPIDAATPWETTPAAHDEAALADPTVEHAHEGVVFDALDEPIDTVAGATDTVASATDTVLGATDTVASATDTVAGALDDAIEATEAVVHLDEVVLGGHGADQALEPTVDEATGHRHAYAGDRAHHDHAADGAHLAHDAGEAHVAHDAGDTHAAPHSVEAHPAEEAVEAHLAHVTPNGFATMLRRIEALPTPTDDVREGWRSSTSITSGLQAAASHPGSTADLEVPTSSPTIGGAPMHEEPTTGSAFAEERSATTGAAAPAHDDAHVSAMLVAVERLAERAREADDALAAVATEVEAFREAQRRFDEISVQREARRQELETFREDVARLAREILGRVEGIFDHMGPAPERGRDPASRHDT